MSQSILKKLLPADYGYVILVAAGSNLVNIYLAKKVGDARKKYGVKYPALYSPDNETFNCIQRSHQNYLETYPFFATALLVGGIENPRASAAAGMVFLIGRILYARGYSTGEPEKRLPGAIMGGLSGLFLLGNLLYVGCVQSGVLGRCSRMIRG